VSPCKYNRRISPYHDGELPLEEQRELKAHICQCASCRRELQHLELLSSFLSAGHVLEMPSAARHRLQHHVSSLPKQLTVRMATGVAAAAAIILVCCSLMLWQQWARHEALPQASADWEVVAVTLQSENASDIATEEPGEWILRDLLQENGYD